MARCTAILEACAFQDLTGQRLSKVTNLIDDLEPRLADLANQSRLEEAVAPETSESRRRRDMMLNGPALRGPEVTQATIDDLFG
jgi:chemotaxis protein CheZ